jgi:hypothetical protein
MNAAAAHAHAVVSAAAAASSVPAAVATVIFVDTPAAACASSNTSEVTAVVVAERAAGEASTSIASSSPSSPAQCFPPRPPRAAASQGLAHHEQAVMARMWLVPAQMLLRRSGGRGLGGHANPLSEKRGSLVWGVEACGRVSHMFVKEPACRARANTYRLRDSVTVSVGGCRGRARGGGFPAGGVCPSTVAVPSPGGRRQPPDEKRVRLVWCVGCGSVWKGIMYACESASTPTLTGCATP